MAIEVRKSLHQFAMLKRPPHRVDAYRIWIGDERVAKDISVAGTDLINAFFIESSHAAVKIWFDDVKVFEK